jgi:hypothetical protein
MTWIGYGITFILRPQKELPWFDPPDISLKLLHVHILLTAVSHSVNVSAGSNDHVIRAVGWLMWAAGVWRKKEQWRENRKP